MKAALITFLFALVNYLRWLLITRPLTYLEVFWREWWYIKLPILLRWLVRGE